MVSMVSKIQPTDPIYQVTDQYKPDKENEWTYPPERDGWVLAHNSLRGEMRLMREALLAMKARDKPLTAWELKALTIAAEGHLEHIHCNHRNEDEILAPECRTRFKYPEKHETDHIALVTKLDSIKSMVGILKKNDKIDDLLQNWIEYENMMLPHLLEEEEIGLPLFRAYFDPKSAKYEKMMLPQLLEEEEIGLPLFRAFFNPKSTSEATHKVSKHASRLELGSFIYFIGEESFRMDVMKRNNIPSKAWYLQFKRELKLFETEFINNVEALRVGKEPVLVESSPPLRDILKANKNELEYWL